MARNAVLRRMSAEDLLGGLGAASAGTPVEGRAQGEGQEGASPDRAGEAPDPDRQRTLVALFDRGTPADARLGRVVAATAERHADRVRAVVVPASGLEEQFQRWRDARRAYDTYDLDRWPLVGVFRGGRLLTTFHPRLVFPDDRLQEREEAQQFDIFLSKMVYYDPSQVKPQKNLELEAGA